MSRVSHQDDVRIPSGVLRDVVKPFPIFASEAGHVVCKVQTCNGLYKEHVNDGNTTYTTPYFLRVKASVPVNEAQLRPEIKASWGERKIVPIEYGPTKVFFKASSCPTCLSFPSSLFLVLSRSRTIL